MILSDYSIKRPVSAIVVSLLIVAFGVLSFRNLAVRELPDMDMPIVSIQTNYRGASANVVESRITQQIEGQVAGLEGLKSLNSRSQDGISEVTLEFELGRDIDSAMNDVRDRVSKVTYRLPDQAEPPSIGKFDLDSQAIMWVNVASETLDRTEITDYVNRYIKERLAATPGVADIQIGGGQRYSMRIRLNRQAMAARALTVSDIENALTRENVELPAGYIESSSQDFTLRVERSYKTPDDFKSLVIRKGMGGHLVQLGEVADVQMAAQERRTLFTGNGKNQIGVGIIKQSTANVLDVAKNARETITQIQQSLPESMTIEPSYDSSIFVDAAIEKVYHTMFEAILLVCIVIYIFLGKVRAAVIPAVTVPISIIGTFFLLDMAGYSINMLTLLGLVIAIGLVVDDAIVVLENCYRRVEEGEPGLLAAYNGSRQVGFAVIATTIVLIGVFLPVIFVKGPIGRMFGELALTLSGAVAISMIVALTLSPMMCSKLVRRRDKKNRFNVYVDAFFHKLADRYARALDVCLRNPWAIRVLFGTCFVLIVGMFRLLPAEFVPNEDRGILIVNVKGPEGMGFDAMKGHVLEIEKLFLKDVGKGDVQRVITQTPSRGRGNAMNNGRIMVILEPWGTRKKSDADLMAEYQPQLSRFSGVNASINRGGMMGGGGGPAIQFIVGAPDYKELARRRDILLDRARANPGLINVDADYNETKPQIQVEIDRQRASDLGVPVADIGLTLETMMGGRRVTTFEWNGEEYDVHVRGEDAFRVSPQDVSNLYVRSARTGELVPLSNLVRLEDRADAAELKRHNRYRAVTIEADVAPDYSTDQALAFLEQVVKDEMPDSPVDYGGDAKSFKEMGVQMLFAFGTALTVVFLILAAQFESFRLAAVIMRTVPAAIVGGVLGLLVTGASINIYSLIGLIILIGIAAKNGILIVEFANQLRDEGKDVDTAIREAAMVRLRPILMTATATAMGAVPLWLGSGPGSISRAAIGAVIVFGCIVATVFTLFIVPTVYRSSAQKVKSPGEIARQLKAHQDAVAAGLPAE